MLLFAAMMFVIVIMYATTI